MNRAGTARVRGWSVAALATALVASPPAAAQPQPAPPAGQSSPLPPPLRFDRIVPETDDLPAIYVTGVVQDSFGFMWFGTQENGLARFDGTTMKPFPVDRDNPNASSDLVDYRPRGARRRRRVDWHRRRTGPLRRQDRRGHEVPRCTRQSSCAQLRRHRHARGRLPGKLVGRCRRRPHQPLRGVTGRFRRFDLSADEAFAPTDVLAAADGTIWVATEGGRVPPRPASRPVVQRLSCRPGRAGERRRAGAARGPRRAAVLGTTEGLFAATWMAAGTASAAPATGPDPPERHRAVRGQGRAAMGRHRQRSNQLDPSREPIVQYRSIRRRRRRPARLRSW